MSEEATMQPREKRRRLGRLPLLGVLAVLAAVSAAVAILVFRVSPWVVVVGAIALLHPLMHLGGGHGRSPGGSEANDSHTGQGGRGCH